jgi:hypothetical protein
VLFLLWEGAAVLAAALLPLAGLPEGIWFGMAGGVPAMMAGMRVLKHHSSTPAVIPAQGQALLAFVLYSVGAGVGVLI